MKNKSCKLRVNYKVWIENKDGDSILGDGKWELLKAIEETGSLKAATEKMDWGYRTTWNKINLLEKKLGFQLIDKQRGGVGGGQTMLTQKGKMLVGFFDEFHKEVDLSISKPIDFFLNKINTLVNDS